MDSMITAELKSWLTFSIGLNYKTLPNEFENVPKFVSKTQFMHDIGNLDKMGYSLTRETAHRFIFVALQSNPIAVLIRASSLRENPILKF